MKRSYFFAITIAAFVLLLPAAPALGQDVLVGPDVEVERQKRAQTGMKFLTVSVDPRATGMGGAVTASLVGSSTSLFYNPATMARMESDFHASFGILQYIVDIDYTVASLAYRPAGGRYGVFGLTFMNVDYGDFFETVRANNDQGFVELGTYTPKALSIGLGYARALTDRFSVGGQAKYASQDLGNFPIARVTTGGTPIGGTPNDGTSATFRDYEQNTLAFDFGVLYATGFRSLIIAMSVRNFSQELRYERENFELPLTFQMGAQMNLVDFTSADPNVHSFIFAADAQRPRDFAEHLKVGAEYTFMNLLSLRAGWAQTFVGDDTEEGYSLGGGLKLQLDRIGFGADYAYTDFGLFGSLNRFAFQVSF